VEIVSGLLRDTSRARGWTAVAGYDVRVELPNGRERFDGQAALRVSSPGTIRPASEAAIHAILRRATKSAGLVLTDLEFAHPLGHLAVEVTVVTENPRGFVKDAHRNFSKVVGSVSGGLGTPWAEGTMLMVRTRSGVWVAGFGYAFRTTSSNWIVNSDFQH